MTRLNLPDAEMDITVIRRNPTNAKAHNKNGKTNHQYSRQRRKKTFYIASHLGYGAAFGRTMAVTYFEKVLTIIWKILRPSA